MKNNNYRKDERANILKRAALAEEIDITPAGWGLNTSVGAQGEWISYVIIQEWQRQGLIEVNDNVGTITAKGRRGEYTYEKGEK